MITQNLTPPNPQIEALLSKASDEINGILTEPEVKPYDWRKHSAGRFNLSELPKPREFLVENFLPFGIVGTICSRGGIGKSVLTLDLAIRIALAAESVESNWLCKFPVIKGGKVLILTGEDAEQDLHFRLYHLVKAISLEGGATELFIHKAISKHIAIINFWGSPEPYALLKKERNSISRTERFYRLLKTVESEKPVLVIIDTRSRFAGGGVDENSNSEVPVEVALYESLAGIGPTVLVCHHANKASYQAGSDNAGSFRGASAWQDNLRWSMHLQSIKTVDGSTCIQVEIPKSNYTPPIEPFHLRRMEEPKFSWTLAEGVSIDKKEAKLEAGLEKVCDFIRKNPGHTKTGVMKNMKGKRGKPGILGWHASENAIEYGLKTEFLKVTEGGFLVLLEE